MAKFNLLNPYLDELARHPRYGSMLGRALATWRSGGSYPHRKWFGFSLSLADQIIEPPGTNCGQCMLGAALVGLAVPGGGDPLMPFKAAGLQEFEILALMDGFDATDVEGVRRGVEHAVERAMRFASRGVDGKVRRKPLNEEPYLQAASDAVQFAVTVAIALGLSNPLENDPSGGQSSPPPGEKTDVVAG